jgi:hypothetical protein
MLSPILPPGTADQRSRGTLGKRLREKCVPIGTGPREGHEESVPTEGTSIYAYGCDNAVSGRRTYRDGGSGVDYIAVYQLRKFFQAKELSTHGA